MSDDRKLTWLAGFSHFLTHSYMTLLPAVLVVIAGEQAMSLMEIGLIANLGYFLYGFGAFLAGYLADRYGSKRLLTIGVLGMAVSSMLVGLSPTKATFAIAYALLGFSASIHHPAGLSLIARRVEVKGRALGLHGVLGNVGLFLTPMAAGLSMYVFGSWRAAYLLFGLVGLGFFFMIYFARIAQEPDLRFGSLLQWATSRLNAGRQPAAGRVIEPGAAEEAADRDRPLVVIPVALLVLYLVSILSGFIFRGSLTFFPALFQREIRFIATNDQPVVLAGIITSAVLSLGLISSWFGGYINDKIRRPELFPVLIFALATPALYLISRFTDSRLLVVSAFFSLVYYAWQPSQNYLVAKYTKKASHGMSFGVNFFLLFGMGSVATAVGGYFADNFGVDRFYWLMSLVSFASLLTAAGVFLARAYQFSFSWRLTRDKAEG